MRSPRTTTKSSPHSPQLEKAHAQQQRPNVAKNKYIKNKKELINCRPFLPVADIVFCHLAFKLFSGVIFSVTITANIGVIFLSSWNWCWLVSSHWHCVCWGIGISPFVVLPCSWNHSPLSGQAFQRLPWGSPLSHSDQDSNHVSASEYFYHRSSLAESFPWTIHGPLHDDGFCLPLHHSFFTHRPW